MKLNLQGYTDQLKSTVWPGSLLLTAT